MKMMYDDDDDQQRTKRLSHCMNLMSIESLQCVYVQRPSKRIIVHSLYASDVQKPVVNKYVVLVEE